MPRISDVGRSYFSSHYYCTGNFHRHHVIFRYLIGDSLTFSSLLPSSDSSITTFFACRSIPHPFGIKHRAMIWLVAFGDLPVDSALFIHTTERRALSSRLKFIPPLFITTGLYGHTIIKHPRLRSLLKSFNTSHREPEPPVAETDAQCATAEVQAVPVVVDVGVNTPVISVRIARGFRRSTATYIAFTVACGRQK